MCKRTFNSNSSSSKTRGEPHHYLSWANWMFLASLIHIYHFCYQCHKSYNLYVSSRKKNTKHKKNSNTAKATKKSMFNVYCLRLIVLLNNEYNYFCLNLIWSLDERPQLTIIAWHCLDLAWNFAQILFCLDTIWLQWGKSKSCSLVRRLRLD